MIFHLQGTISVEKGLNFYLAASCVELYIFIWVVFLSFHENAE